MNDARDRTKVEWREWGADAFEAAAATGTPILLSLSATWCSWCREMDHVTYDEPRIAANVNDGFVPVRVDVDRQPRVRERYNMGGFPSTVFCTPTGDLIAGATYLEPEGFRQVLDRVREAWDAKGAEAGRIPRALQDQDLPSAEVTADVERFVAGQLDEQFDVRHAGWGESEKFPLPHTVEFALKREREQALRTLDKLSHNLFDDFDGGFYRYAAGRDWSDPRREKLLDTNAALLRAFAHAYLYTGNEDYREPAERTVDYLTTTLWREADAQSAADAQSTADAGSGSGAFGGSQAPGEYYDLDPAERAEAEAPPIDPTAFAEKNALAADALLRFHAYTGHAGARRYAERTLEYLAANLVDDEGVVTHFDDPESERGLLTDHAAVVRAFATAAQVLDPVHVETARLVADAAIDRLRVETGAFGDGPDDGVGLLDRPLYPIDDTATLANALVDLHYLTGEVDADVPYHEVAREALGAFAGAADRMGVQVAGYATAAARVVGRPLVIAVAAAAGSDLHRAALRVADHEKVVVPDADAVTPAATYERGNAYVVTADGPSEPAGTPDELSSLVAEHS